MLQWSCVQKLRMQQEPNDHYGKRGRGGMPFQWPHGASLEDIDGRDREREPYILHLDLNFSGQLILLWPFKIASRLYFLLNGYRTVLRSYFLQGKFSNQIGCISRASKIDLSLMNIKAQTIYKCPINHVSWTKEVVVVSISPATYSCNTTNYMYYVFHRL